MGATRSKKYANIFLPIIREYFKKHGIDPAKGGTEVSNTSETASKKPNEYAPELFERLRVKRKTIADEDGVPAYCIFQDRTLREMAIYFPQTEEEFRQIHGVGPMTFEKYADDFLPIIHDYCKEHGSD